VISLRNSLRDRSELSSEFSIADKRSVKKIRTSSSLVYCIITTMKQGMILASSFHLSSHFIAVSNHSIVAPLLYIMFHPAFVSLCFSITYFMLHSIPSSSSLSVLHYHNDASCYDLHLTASSEFSSFKTILLSYFLTSHTYNIFTSPCILLSGDIQSNLGPVSHVSSFNMYTLNTRSFTYPVHYTAIADLAIH